MPVIVTAPEEGSVSVHVTKVYNIAEIVRKLEQQQPAAVELEKVVEKPFIDGTVRMQREFNYYDHFHIKKAKHVTSAWFEINGLEIWRFENTDARKNIEVVFNGLTHETSLVFPSLHVWALGSFHVSENSKSGTSKPVLKCRGVLLHPSIASDFPFLRWSLPVSIDMSLLFTEGLVGKIKNTELPSHFQYDIQVHGTHGQLRPVDPEYLNVTVYHKNVNEVLKLLKGVHPNYKFDDNVILTNPPCKDIILHNAQTDENMRILDKQGATYRAQKRFGNYSAAQMEIMKAGNVKKAARMSKVLEWCEGSVALYPYEDKAEILKRMKTLYEEQSHYQ